MQPGQAYTFNLNVATFLNGETVFIESVGSGSFTASYVHADYTSAPDTGTAIFEGIEIYRNADGGGLLYFDAALPNPGAGVAWTYTDTNTDAELDNQVIAPLDHLNDPPPGAPGSLVTPGGTILCYWLGRLWMAVGNKLYFTAGADCINGVPEESWPPANVFSYDGPIYGLARTSQGLLVWGADYVSMALGGPQTLSFYPYDLMKNFGISSPNCLAQDGDTISVISTAGQFWTLNVSGETETGNYVSDLIAGDFFPATSYVAYHRQGYDSGLWLGDGSTNLLRYGLTIGCWSTLYKPVGGIGALGSIETAVGVRTLLAGRAQGAGYILGRNLNDWQDDGQLYTGCTVTIGNISLSPLGAALIPVEHIALYCDAVGGLATGGGATIPSVEILPNEISSVPGSSTSQGVGFVELTDPVSEYTTAANPSQSILALSWPTDSITQGTVTKLMHHLQVRISFPPENAPNTIKAMAIKFVKN